MPIDIIMVAGLTKFDPNWSINRIKASLMTFRQYVLNRNVGGNNPLFATKDEHAEWRKSWSDYEALQIGQHS